MRLDFTTLWDALGWAILHSLWQGALIGALVWGLRALATERRANLRYLAGMAGLAATFAAFLTTFVILARARLDEAAANAANGLLRAGDAELGTTVSISLLPSPAVGSAASLEMALSVVPWLGILWAVGFTFLGIQAYRAWSQTRFLATEGLSAPDSDWSARFADLIAKTGTSERVRLFISDHVSGPMTLGALKPIVLVPAGFLTGLPSTQVEAILLHELAHIRRHDFLFGLIQTAIRTVLYFNPAVLILSRAIDTDREQACDDIAVRITGRPVDLVRGLAALRLGSQSPDLAMAADGGPLLERLNRLMGRPAVRRTPDRLSAIAISAIMLSAAACGTVSQAHPHTPEPPVLELPDTVVRPDGPSKVYVDGEFMGHIELPPMPVMPAAPVVPPMPPMPAMSPSDFLSEREFEASMDAWEDRMEAWGEEMERVYENEYEVEMEAWEEEMDAWGEAVEAMTERFTDAEEARLQQRITRDLQRAEREAERAERELQRMERDEARAQRDMERAERDRERAQRHQERMAARSHARFGHASSHTISVTDPNETDVVNVNGRELRLAQFGRDVRRQLVRDGLIDASSTPVRLSMTCDTLHVNGRRAPDSLNETYQTLFSDAGLVLRERIELDIRDDFLKIDMTAHGLSDQD